MGLCCFILTALWDAFFRLLVAFLIASFATVCRHSDTLKKKHLESKSIARKYFSVCFQRIRTRSYITSALSNLSKLSFDTDLICHLIPLLSVPPKVSHSCSLLIPCLLCSCLQSPILGIKKLESQNYSSSLSYATHVTY